MGGGVTIGLGNGFYDVIKWKHFPRNWPFVRGNHRSPVNSPHKGQWRGALMFSLIYDWIKNWVNNREAGELRRHCGHYDVIVMISDHFLTWFLIERVTLGTLVLYPEIRRLWQTIIPISFYRCKQEGNRDLAVIELAQSIKSIKMSLYQNAEFDNINFFQSFSSSNQEL